MFVSPETLCLLAKLGVVGADAVEVIRAFEQDMQAQTVPVKGDDHRRERNRRYYEKRQKQGRELASEERLNKTPEASYEASYKTSEQDGGFPEAKSPPEPPKKTQPLPTPPLPPTGEFPPQAGRPAQNGKRLPEDWQPDTLPADYGLSPERHADELAKFRDYWRSVPGAKGRKLDWNATWRNWLRRAAEQQPRNLSVVRNERPDTSPFSDNLARAFAGSEIALGARRG